MTDARDLLRRLVESFGDPAATSSLLSDDVRWHLYTGKSTPLTGVHEGRSTVLEMHRTVFGDLYEPESVEVTIHDVTGNDDRAALRFRLQARMTWGAAYDTEYAIFARVDGDEISEVWEYLDSLAATEQLAGTTPEDAFAPADAAAGATET